MFGASPTDEVEKIAVFRMRFEDHFRPPLSWFDLDRPALRPVRNLALAIMLALIPAAAMPNGPGPIDPIRFFQGTTETLSTVKVVMKKSYRSRSIGRGRIDESGTLVLIQKVEDEGRAPTERRWQIRQIAPGRFSGSMSDARGLVTITQVGGRYRLHFKTKSRLAVEQWITPSADGRFARTESTIRQVGIKVATSNGTIHKLD